MTTVEDKLKLFAKIVFEKVEKESEQKVEEFSKNQDQLLESEKRNIIKESENLIKQTKKKAEDKRRQIISKANIDRQHALLKKRKEIFDRAIDDIRNLALLFTNQPEYAAFLEKCISNGLSKIEDLELEILLKTSDIENYGNTIKELLDKYKKPGMTVRIIGTEEDILGGCIFVNSCKTLRVDCSMASVIEDNRGLIGRTLMDNLQ